MSKSGNAAGVAAETTKSEAKPTKVLPTHRVAFSKQLDILRGFGAAHETSGKPVANIEVAKIVGLHASTIGLVTPFFAGIGLLQRGSDGHTPVKDVLEFNRANQWNPDTACHRIGSIVRSTWFSQAILPRLHHGPMNQREVIQELAVAASAGPKYSNQIETLLEYMAAAGVVVREGEIVKLGQSPGHTPHPSSSSSSSGSTSSSSTGGEAEPKPHAPVATSFTNPTAGVVQFNISVKVDMSEMSNWNPERITAFFGGVAQVLAAKGKIEGDAARA